MRATFLAPALLCVVSAEAQTLRQFTASRPHRSEARLDVTVSFPRGTLRVGPAPAGVLYAVDATYDPSRYAPVAAFDASGLTAGLVPASAIRIAAVSQPAEEGLVRLSPDVDVALAVEVAGAEARLDLGGLRLTSLRFEGEGSQSVLRFASPNRALCTEAEITVTGGTLDVQGFGNSGCRTLRLRGGVGRVNLDFAGDLPAAVSADLAVTVGELVLRVPRGVGVRLTSDRFLAGLDVPGLMRSGNAWVSPDYDTARRKVELRVASTVGSVKIEH